MDDQPTSSLDLNGGTDSEVGGGGRGSPGPYIRLKWTLYYLPLVRRAILYMYDIIPVVSNLREVWVTGP